MRKEKSMKLPFNSRLSAIVLSVCMSLGLAATEVSAGERVEYNQFFFAPVTTRALFPGINLDGPALNRLTGYPSIYGDLPASNAPFLWILTVTACRILRSRSVTTTTWFLTLPRVIPRLFCTIWVVRSHSRAGAFLKTSQPCNLCHACLISKATYRCILCTSVT